jgi:hypothetical protein
MSKLYTVIDGIPTINPLSPIDGKPLAISEAELDQRIAEVERLREEFWARRPASERVRPNGCMSPLPHDPSYK